MKCFVVLFERNKLLVWLSVFVVVFFYHCPDIRMLLRHSCLLAEDSFYILSMTCIF